MTHYLCANICHQTTFPTRVSPASTKQHFLHQATHRTPHRPALGHGHRRQASCLVSITALWVSNSAGLSWHIRLMERRATTTSCPGSLPTTLGEQGNLIPRGAPAFTPAASGGETGRELCPCCMTPEGPLQERKKGRGAAFSEDIWHRATPATGIAFAAGSWRRKARKGLRIFPAISPKNK